MWLLQAESGCALDYEVCNLMEGAHMAPEFKARNPMHCIPTITDENGLEIWECNACMQYLCNKFDLAQYPKDLKQRAECDVMLHHRNTQIVKNFGIGLLYGKVGFGADQSDEEEKKTIEAICNDVWPAMQKFIDSNGGAFLGGASPNIADMVIFGYLNLVSVVRPNLSIFKADGRVPGLPAWVDAMKARPSYATIDTPERMGFWKSKAIEKEEFGN